MSIDMYLESARSQANSLSSISAPVRATEY